MLLVLQVLIQDAALTALSHEEMAESIYFVFHTYATSCALIGLRQGSLTPLKAFGIRQATTSVPTYFVNSHASSFQFTPYSL